LVTGAAGFIGHELAAELSRRGIKEVVGLDDFNDYYSPAYKQARARDLGRNYNLTVVAGSVCDRGLTERLFAEHKFTHVVHLAAQAGVRYSLSHPQTYVKANVECFVDLLEVMRDHAKETHFVYASSSSVYGNNEKIPFEETDRVDSPASLYGATKKSNEVLAYAYNTLFGISTVGLRFFTVYGPWGRPDMAAYLFTDRISKGLPLRVYNHGQMKRDFTYVTDIVSGIIGSMQYCPGTPEVFNLGNNQPVELMKFIKIIEKEVGREAVLQYAESKGEVLATYANVDKANLILGYQPTTSIEDGLHKFVEWYKSDLRQEQFIEGEYNK